jgi:hypothetical protein
MEKPLYERVLFRAFLESKNKSYKFSDSLLTKSMNFNLKIAGFDNVKQTQTNR